MSRQGQYDDVPLGERVLRLWNHIIVTETNMILPVYASRRGKLGNAYCFVLVFYVVWLLPGASW